MMKSILIIKNLNASVGDKKILKNINLTLKSGETHAMMGPNGSGKSTLAYTLMGQPDYKIIRNDKIRPILPIRPIKDRKINKTIMKIGTKDIINLSTEERARAGLFLAMQSPVALPGVTVVNLLREAYQSLYGGDERRLDKTVKHNPIFLRRFQGNDLSLPQFMEKLKAHADFLGLDGTFLTRGINDGFSGGEKKKLEMLQALVLHQKFAIFDEIDTGLDVDALETVAGAIKLLASQGTGILIITHYQRILKYLKPDFVHILVAGSIVESGKAHLARKIENEGYRKFVLN